MDVCYMKDSNKGLAVHFNDVQNRTIFKLDTRNKIYFIILKTMFYLFHALL